MLHSTRRDFLHTAAASTLALLATPVFAAPAAKAPLTLGFSLYGMKGIKTDKALRTLAQIGYDSVELCLMKEWETTPTKFSSAARREVRKILASTGLKLTALMEHTPLTGTASEQKPVLEQLKRAAELAHDLNPDSPPLIETVAGSGRWQEQQNTLRDNLVGWGKVAEQTKTLITVKPHRGGVVDRPEQGVWLVKQVANPWIRLNYDYSHFAHRDIPLADSIRTMIPHTRFIHVKDTVIREGRAHFLLPGESGQLDYAQLLTLVHNAGYRGDICCEVSSMVFRQQGYDPLAAARTCYKNLSAAFQEAQIPRPAAS